MVFSCVDVPQGFGVHWFGNWCHTKMFNVKITSIYVPPPLCTPNWCHVVLKVVYLWDKGRKNVDFGAKMTIFGHFYSYFDHFSHVKN